MGPKTVKHTKHFNFKIEGKGSLGKLFEFYNNKANDEDAFINFR
jgi:hypothetical protein